MWGVCLEQMFKHGHSPDVNDSYYLMKNFENFEYYRYIHTIYNHNSLNFLSSNEQVITEFPLTTLIQNFTTNNISRPRYIYKLLEMVGRRYPEEISNLFDIVFNNKFYDMIKILSTYGDFLNYWIDSFVNRNKTCDGINDEAKQEIIALINMNIVTPVKIRKLLKNISYSDLLIRHEVLLFLKNTYDV
jgi:hypothetical protein